MRFAALAIVASAGIAAAQTTSAAATTPTGSSSDCQAQNIVDACIEGYQSRIEDCSANDWICLCDVYNDVLTCYNNCPDSNERPPVQNQVTQYCNAAAPLKSASSASAATAVRTSAQVSSTGSAASATGSQSSATGSAASSAASTFETGAASAVNVPAFGGAFAALLGLAGLL